METIAKKRMRFEMNPIAQLGSSTEAFEDHQDYLRPEGSRYCDEIIIQSDPKDYSFLVPDAFTDEENEPFGW